MQPGAYEPVDQKLMATDGVCIKQKFDLLEALTGCDRPNKYNVYPLKYGKDKKAKKIFKWKEKSNMCNRLMPIAWKKFKQRCYNLQSGKEEDEYCLRCEKKCACPMLCLNRMEMHVYHCEKGVEQKLGRV